MAENTTKEDIESNNMPGEEVEMNTLKKDKGDEEKGETTTGIGDLDKEKGETTGIGDLDEEKEETTGIGDLDEEKGETTGIGDLDEEKGKITTGIGGDLDRNVWPNYPSYMLCLLASMNSIGYMISFEYFYSMHKNGEYCEFYH